MASLTTGQATRNVDDRPTTVIVQPFADRVLVLITQLGKVGNLIQASLPPTTPSIPPSSPDTLPTPPAAIQLTNLLGSAPTDHMRLLHSLYASQVATMVWVHGSIAAIEASRRSVVVGLALQSERADEGADITESERKSFHSIMDIVQQLLRQV
ncbi:hypothetical protein JOM56_003471 [Amanita muscaria]